MNRDLIWKSIDLGKRSKRFSLKIPFGASGKFHARNLLLVFVAFLFILPVAFPAIPVFAETSCSPAGGTGLTAFMVVSSSHQKISGLTINASGCDIGIYVGHGASDVLIQGVVITGASQHAILVQDTSHIRLVGNYISGNGVGSIVCPAAGAPPPGCIPENKPIELVGTSNSVVASNVVVHNSADGGIGIADDGPQNPGAPLGVAGLHLSSHNDVVKENLIVDNTRGCGIVIAAYNPGEGIHEIQVKDNVIVGQAPMTPITSKSGPFIGQIVVATDGPFAVISSVHVTNNFLDGSFLPGIVLHANVFGDKIVNTLIKGNLLTENGFYPGPPNPTSNTPGVIQGTTGISLVAENPSPPNTPPAVISHTSVLSNSVFGDKNGVWLCYTTQTQIQSLNGNSLNPVATCAAGGS